MCEIKTVALVGLGAIGSYLAVAIQKAVGFENLRIVASRDRRERLLQEGLVVNGQAFRFRVVEPCEEMEAADLAIFITKAGGLDQAILDMERQIGENTILMSPLNGVESEELLAKHYGWERILYSLARVSVIKNGNQVSFRENMAHMEYGEPDNTELTPRVLAVRELFDRAGLVSVIPKDMVHAIWHKFMCNVSENQSAAILGIPFGAWRCSANRLREAIMGEVAAVAAAKGICLTEEEIKKQRERLVKIPFQNKPSTLQDIEARRTTEVDIFAGTMIRLGRETGVPTPYNEFMYHAIKVLEEKNRGLFDVTE